MSEQNYKDYLAARILTENRPVTYRLLSRALRVDVNSAKRMLFEFYQQQCARKPNSVHATYLVTGTKRKTEHTNGVNGRNGGDVAMRSSPFPSSMPEPEDHVNVSIKITTISLVREEELQRTRAEFDTETSIHIYSLEPGPIEQLNVLSVCNREVTADYSDGEPLEWWKSYGLIRNPFIKRRTAKYNPAASTSTTKPNEKPVTIFSTNQAKKDSLVIPRGSSTSENNASGRPTPQPAAVSNTLKRSSSQTGAKKSQMAGDLFKSFAKAKPKAKDAATSQESTPAPVEDELMQGMSEDEGDDDGPEVKVDEEKLEAARKAREERQEKLRKMMDDDDEEMPDAPITNDSPPETTGTTQPDAADSAEDAETTPTVVVENGRRRGKRRVMKKKKVKDEDGYLVTKEEAVWESFSEEEPEPKKLKPVPAKPTSSAKGKTAGKKGQGSIASFFKKA